MTFWSTLSTALATGLGASATLAAERGNRVASRCGMGAAFCAYANALRMDGAPEWQRWLPVVGAVLLLGSAIHAAVTRTPAQPKADA